MDVLSSLSLSVIDKIVSFFSSCEDIYAIWL